MCHNGQLWTKLLPVILLGLKTSIKEDINASAAEMLYGENLSLPGEFFLDLDVRTDPTCFVQHLQDYLQKIHPKRTAHHGKKGIFLFRDLATCTHVFVRVDSSRRPLQPPYEGPFPVLEWNNKVFKVLIKGQPATISIDRVKPAHTESNALPSSTSLDQSQGPPVISDAPKVYSSPKKKTVTFAPTAQSLEGG
ncbi:uncharacterized protein LOC118647486 [Monomorium pharaonis]|uniref:uncharacterized protein LOC118647486 n=1 Tax=Monomorium pharaonis TaxID=307658 RepID=UPI0017479477|nr:uncharacterized protein LOC118647486 [Monomorium pharaonis]